MGQKRIRPREVTEIKASFSSGNLTKRVTKHVYVSSNDPDEPIVKLTVTGTVTAGPRISVSPRDVNLGLIWVQDEFKDTLIVKNVGKADLLINEVKMLGKNGIVVKLISDEVIPSDRKGKIEISYKLDTRPQSGKIRSIEDYIVITSNDGAHPELWIPIKGHITDDPWFATLYDGSFK